MDSVPSDTAVWFGFTVGSATTIDYDSFPSIGANISPRASGGVSFPSFRSLGMLALSSYKTVAVILM